MPVAGVRSLTRNPKFLTTERESARQKDEQQRVKPNRGVGSGRSWRVVFRRAFSPEAVGRLECGSVRWCEVHQVSIGNSPVVEHKAQTHLRGFAVVSLFVGASCPDAHMYRSGADVRHMPGRLGARKSSIIQH
jgi:hypothetical protein